MKGFGKRDINFLIMFVCFFIFFTIIYVNFRNEGFISGQCPDTEPTELEIQHCKNKDQLTTIITCNNGARKISCKKY